MAKVHYETLTNIPKGKLSEQSLLQSIFSSDEIDINYGYIL